MRTQNAKVIDAFFEKKNATSPIRNIANGYFVERGASISTDGAILYSYWTPIAKWVGEKVQVATHKYSNTTTRQQSDLRHALNTNDIEYVEVEYV